MREELLIKRSFIKKEMGLLILMFMEETDIEKGRQLSSSIRKLSKEIESINCELALIEIKEKLNKRA